MTRPDRTPPGILERSIVPLLIVGAIAVFALYRVAAPRPERPEATAEDIPLADPDAVYDPVRAGEPLPQGFRQLLPRDRILPVYDPQFVPAGEAGWTAETLVIGVAGEVAAKAYPVSHLSGREMVIDSLEGIPILVTW